MASISRLLSLPSHSNYMPFPPKHSGGNKYNMIPSNFNYGDTTTNLYITNYDPPDEVYKNKASFSYQDASQYRYVVKKQSDNSIFNSGVLAVFDNINTVNNVVVGTEYYFQVYTDINGSTAYSSPEYFTAQTSPDVGPVPSLLSFNSSQIIVGWNPDMSLQRWGYAPEQDRSWNVKLRRTTSGFPVVEEKIYSYGSSTAIFTGSFSGTYFVGLYPENLTGGPRAYQVTINFTIPAGPYFPYFPYFGPPIY